MGTPRMSRPPTVLLRASHLLSLGHPASPGRKRQLPWRPAVVTAALLRVAVATSSPTAKFLPIVLHLDISTGLMSLVLLSVSDEDIITRE